MIGALVSAEQELKNYKNGHNIDLALMKKNYDEFNNMANKSDSRANHEFFRGKAQGIELACNILNINLHGKGD